MTPLAIGKRLGLACLFLAAGTFCAPVFAQAPFDRGVALYNQRSYRAAIEWFDKAIQSDSSHRAACYYQALCYHQLGDLARAKGLYRQLMTRFPGTEEARLAATVLNRLDPQPPQGDKPPASLQAAAATAAPRDPIALSDAEWDKLPNEVKIPFYRGIGNHLYVDATINNRPARMIFDTGAEVTLVGKNHLQQLAIPPKPSGQKMQVGGVGGSASAAVMDAVVTIGGITRPLHLVVQDHLPTDPLLGQNFFKGFSYEIDNRGGFIRMVKKPRPGQSGARDFQPYDTFSVPFTPAGNNLVVNVEVNGKATPMYFDTGASGIVFSLWQILALGVQIPGDAQPVVGRGVGGDSAGYRFEIDRIKLGAIDKTRVPVLVLLNGGPPLPLLGQSFFGDRKFTIDSDKRVIRFVH